MEELLTFITRRNPHILLGNTRENREILNQMKSNT